MSNVTKTVTKLNTTATMDGATTPKIYNVTATLANTEYSQALTAGTKQILVRCRGSAKLQLAWQTGETNTNFVTIEKGCSYKADGLTYTGTVYFESSLASQIIEIEEWS